MLSTPCFCICESFCIIPIQTPFDRIGVDVLPYPPIILFVPNDVIVERSLEYGFPDFTMNKSFECRYDMWNQSICRGRRPRRPLTDDLKYHMYMIWHNDIFFDRYILNPVGGFNIFPNDLTVNRQIHLRGVVGAAPTILPSRFRRPFVQIVTKYAPLLL